LETNAQAQEILQNEDIGSKDLTTLLEFRKNEQADFVLVDIRESFEIDKGYIKGCDLFCPTSDFMTYIEEFEKHKDRHIVLYCRSGNRSDQTKHFLKQRGFSKISHLAEGIIAYSGTIA